MISRIFIDRPIFAWVLAIVVMLAGIGGILGLPIAQYPDVAPPQVTIRATYPGANAQTLQNAVTQVVEQTLTGIDGLLYFQSSSSSRGRSNDAARRAPIASRASRSCSTSTPRRRASCPEVGA